ncbi:hypothetical protein RF11_15998 [Thelohanellus kitauei]|uniref:Uncharacterized protein n=1 Tax=Thelohanellus kitauei TaxID=669202 RepID=A0A0C2IM91_THEKT|nr:hypothetical protein RF11_15998 [Thelohanellus kitauei]
MFEQSVIIDGYIDGDSMKLVNEGFIVIYEKHISMILAHDIEVASTLLLIDVTGMCSNIHMTGLDVFQGLRWLNCHDFSWLKIFHNARASVSPNDNICIYQVHAYLLMLHRNMHQGPPH